MNYNKATIALIAATAALALAGCSTPSTTPQPAASAAVIEPGPGTAAPSPSFKGKQFGEINTWTNGISISVSRPTEFTPGQYAMGATEGETPVYFKIVLTNNSDEPFQPSAYEGVSSGGKESRAIFDTGNEVGDLGTPPSNVILPGGTVEWFVAYSVADPENILFQIEPDPFYDTVVFTNVSL